MSSWIGWLFLLALIALAVILVRGIVHFASWAFEEYVESRWLRHRGDEAESRGRQGQPRETPHKRPPVPSHGRDVKSKTLSEVAIARHEHRPSRLGKLLKSWLGAATGKGYDYWVGAALAEDDWSAKVEYLAKALRLNPAYLPAWGLQGNALFHLQRYEEALQCFERYLEMHPSAPVFYKKGLCLYHLKRPGEAMACLDQALQACTDRDRELFEEASHMRETVAAELHGGATA
jgi:tetratricopeptide (TPR) repeat protein